MYEEHGYPTRLQRLPERELAPRAICMLCDSSLVQCLVSHDCAGDAGVRLHTQALHVKCDNSSNASAHMQSLDELMRLDWPEVAEVRGPAGTAA
jgi:hypothetical protein